MHVFVVLTAEMFAFRAPQKVKRSAALVRALWNHPAVMAVKLRSLSRRSSRWKVSLRFSGVLHGFLLH